MTGARRALAVAGAVSAVAGSAYAADQLAGTDRPPPASVVTIDATAPLFDAGGLVGGQTLDRCTVLTNQGPQPADVTLFGSASEADLSPWLDLELVRGTLPPGAPAGDCGGFVPDPADYGAGTPGVVFRGTLASLPAAEAGIADPTRWAVGESHAYLLRVHYTGDDPQQGLSTVQTFSWGATPFDDRPAAPLVETTPAPATEDPGTQTPMPGTSGDGPLGDGIAGAAGGPSGGEAGAGSTATGGPAGTTIRLDRQCRVLTFPGRAYVGARAISRPVKLRGAKKQAVEGAGDGAAQPLASTTASVVAPGEAVGAGERLRRQDLLSATRRRANGSAARRMPVLVVRLSPNAKTETISVRVGLRKNAQMTSPRRWRWVRFRLNGGATKSTLRWPFSATAGLSQLRTGYNQLDLTLDRGSSADRVKGTPRLMRRSFAFIVGEPSGGTTAGSATADCTLG